MQFRIVASFFILCAAAAPQHLSTRDVTCGQEGKQADNTQPACCDLEGGSCSLLELFDTCHVNKMYCCDFSNNVS